MIGGVATSAAVRTWPFRVFSFPTKVNTFNGTLPELLVPGLRNLFVSWFDFGSTWDQKIWVQMSSTPGVDILTTLKEEELAVA